MKRTVTLHRITDVGDILDNVWTQLNTIYKANVKVLTFFIKKGFKCRRFYLFSSNGAVFMSKVKTLPGFSFTMLPVIKLNFQVFVGLDDFNTFFVFP